MGDQFLTYEDVAKDGYGFWDLEEQMPAVAQRLCRTAERAAQTLGIRGMGRIDFRIDEKGTSFVTDVSTSPHITAHSSFAYVHKAAGRDPNELPAILVALAARRSGWL